MASAKQMRGLRLLKKIAFHMIKSQNRRHSESQCMKQPLVSHHFKWRTNKLRASRRSVWEISATLTPSRVQTARKADYRMSGCLKRGAWHRWSTYSHKRMPFSSADRKSLLPNVFLVTAWRERKKKGGGGVKKQWANYCQAVWWAKALVCIQGGKFGEER